MVRLLFIFFISFIAYSQNYVKFKPKAGDGLISIFQKYEIDYTKENIKLFTEINKIKNTSLILGKEYSLPIQIFAFNGKNIRTSIDNNNYDFAYAVQLYNEKLTEKGVKEAHYKIDKEIWLPVNFKIVEESKDVAGGDKAEKIKEKEKKNEDRIYPILGKKYEKITPVDNVLDKCAFYLVSGHGGPDPGAQAEKDGKILSEDEYAYDVILRLGLELIKHGAEVFFIVQDENDGIRDDVYLSNSKDEFYYGGEKIHLSQRQRLKDRSDIVNKLYNANPAKKKNHHAISIHVDSRVSNEKQIDIFFYHNENSKEGEIIANSLLATIKSKYQEAQPGRGYEGSVSSRNLFVLRHFQPVTTFIELGNIQNYRDQQRIVIANNRQAIANWLCDGLIEYYKAK